MSCHFLINASTKCKKQMHIEQKPWQQLYITVTKLMLFSLWWLGHPLKHSAFICIFFLFNLSSKKRNVSQILLIMIQYFLFVNRNRLESLPFSWSVLLTLSWPFFSTGLKFSKTYLFKISTNMILNAALFPQPCENAEYTKTLGTCQACMWRCNATMSKTP